MATNVSIWLRAFRPPLQGVYPRPDETDLELADLLRQADERKPAADPPPGDETGEDNEDEPPQGQDPLAPAAPNPADRRSRS